MSDDRIRISKTGDVVFILGAGTSKHTGLPLLCDFFQHAETIKIQNQHGQNAPNGYAAALERVHAFRRLLKVENPQLDTHNIEEVYAEALKVGNAERDLIPSLNRVILGVLDLGGCSIHYRDRQYHPDPIYARFVEKLTDIWQRITFITFNWDCFLDYALFFYGLPPDYGLQGSPGRIKFLKIHGSLNWGKCRGCGKGPLIIKPNDKIGMRPGVERRKRASLDLRLSSEILDREYCHNCKKSGFEPIIIPPMPNKDFEAGLEQPLKKAHEAIANAVHIYFLGYSFPESDQYFVNFVRKAFVENVYLREVNIINPDEKVIRRYEKNLEIQRNHLRTVFTPFTFEKFVNELAVN